MRFTEVIIESKAPQNFAMKVIEYMYKCVCLLYTELKFKLQNLLCMGVFLFYFFLNASNYLKEKFKPFGTFLFCQ